MKFLKNKFVAIAITAAVIVGCLGYGQTQRPWSGSHAVVESADTGNYDASAYADWCYDEANILSSNTEALVDNYNAKWDAQYGTILALATVEDTDGYIEGYAYGMADDAGLGADDMMLLISAAENEYWVVTADRVINATGEAALQKVFDANFDQSFADGNYDRAVNELYADLDELYANSLTTHVVYGADMPAPAYQGQSLAGILLFLLVLVLVVSAIDKARYRTWYRSYGTIASPPVTFVPLLFWHRPGGLWYRRMFGSMGGGIPRGPAPGAARPGSYGVKNPGSNGARSGYQTSNRGSGFGSTANRGSGFTGSSRSSFTGSTRSSSSRSGFGGGFGGSSRGGGFGGGGFGGSRGGFGGGSRGGFGGGGRGGGFGGKR